MSYTPKALEEFEARLTALELLGATDEEREVSALVFKIVRSVKLTLWLTNGAVRWFGMPLGILWGLYAYGANAATMVLHFIAGGPR